MADFIAARLVVGDTSSVALPPKATSPRLIPGVSSSVNSLPASFAASSRLGATSVDTIDSDTSITSITTARLRGMRTSCVGAASATASITSAITSRIAGTWRQRWRLATGATFASSSMLANRSTRRCRANWTTT